jgi:hypothetical protein
MTEVEMNVRHLLEHNALLLREVASTVTPENDVAPVLFLLDLRDQRAKEILNGFAEDKGAADQICQAVTSSAIPTAVVHFDFHEARSIVEQLHPGHFDRMHARHVPLLGRLLVVVISEDMIGIVALAPR